MFLKPHTPRRSARPDASAENERGSALVLVIILLVVLTAMGLLVAAIAMHAIGATSATRAGMQSQAAADAGVDYAASQIGISHDCDPTYHSASSSVDFDVEAYYSLTDDHDDWVACPINAAKAKRIKLVSTGTAATKGMLDRSSGDVTKVEAIFAFHAPDPIPASGSALYSFSGPTFNDTQVISSTGEPANVEYYNGDFSCTGGSTLVEGSVLVGNGNATLDTGCTIDKDVRASGVIKINNGTVGGNVTAAATGNAHYFLKGQAHVGGYIALGGTVATFGSCGGGDTACIVGGLESDVAGGSVTFNDSTVHKPVVTPWIDYGYDSLDDQERWSNAGFVHKDWNVADWHCNVDSTTVDVVRDALEGLTHDTVFDARDCDSFILASADLDVELKHSVTFIVPDQVDLQRLTFSANPTADSPSVWFITPDETEDDQPTCPHAGHETKVQQSVALAEPVSGLIYTPCTAHNFSNDWRGQFYGGEMNFEGTSSINFVPVGLAGVDLGTGEEGGTKGILGGQLTNRNIAG